METTNEQLIKKIIDNWAKAVRAKDIQGILAHHSSNVLLLFLTALGIGCIAGIYPALILSSYKPIIVLKGRKIWILIKKFCALSRSKC